VAGATVAVVDIILEMTMEHCVSLLEIRHITICRGIRYIFIMKTQGGPEEKFR
jgi:hypothetical protein